MELPGQTILTPAEASAEMAGRRAARRWRRVTPVSEAIAVILAVVGLWLWWTTVDANASDVDIIQDRLDALGVEAEYSAMTRNWPDQRRTYYFEITRNCSTTRLAAIFIDEASVDDEERLVTVSWRREEVPLGEDIAQQLVTCPTG